MTTKDITELRTINSMYGDGIIEVYVDEELYRIKTTELVKMLANLPLEVTMARKYNYLTIKGV